jgi:LysB family phage lysis regulatory protein
MTFRAYIALAVLLAFMGLGGVALYYRAEAADAAKEAQQAISDRDKAVEANAASQNTISALQEQSRLDSRLTSSLVEEMRKISDGLAEQSQQIDELEKSNADVRAYLDTVVPADLRKLRQR